MPLRATATRPIGRAHPAPRQGAQAPALPPPPPARGHRTGGRRPRPRRRNGRGRPRVGAPGRTHARDLPGGHRAVGDRGDPIGGHLHGGHPRGGPPDLLRRPRGRPRGVTRGLGVLRGAGQPGHHPLPRRVHDRRRGRQVRRRARHVRAPPATPRGASPPHRARHHGHHRRARHDHVEHRHHCDHVRRDDPRHPRPARPPCAHGSGPGHPGGRQRGWHGHTGGHAPPMPSPWVSSSRRACA